MAEYIDREAVLNDSRWNGLILGSDIRMAKGIVLCKPVADVVSRVAYEQAMFERDLAIEQLRNDYGVGLGQKRSDNVEKVVHCRDCKHWHEKTGWCNHHSHFLDNAGEFCYQWESADWKMFDENYYCKDGERRSNG